MSVIIKPTGLSIKRAGLAIKPAGLSIIIKPAKL